MLYLFTVFIQVCSEGVLYLFTVFIQVCCEGVLYLFTVFIQVCCEGVLYLFTVFIKVRCEGVLYLFTVLIQVRREGVRYLQEPELKEEGGTPAIVEAIRAGLVFQLKQAVTPALILQREEHMLRSEELKST